MRANLPDFYYLTHFHEFLSHLKTKSADLLRETDRTFLNAFQALAKEQQALVVRLVNRSQPWVRRASLNYSELTNWKGALSVLEQQQWVVTASATLTSSKLQSFLHTLTKAELQRIYVEVSSSNSRNLPFSAAKAHWIAACQALTLNQLQSAAITSEFVALADPVAARIRYLLFIYFGRTETDFKQFSLRDLGIRPTHEEAHVNSESLLRFETIEAAESALYYSELRQQLADSTLALAAFDDIDTWPTPIGPRAERLALSCRFRWGEAIKDSDPALACDVWEATAHPKAQEQAVRLLYQCGEQERAIALAEAIIRDPLDDSLALFAEDFVARKVGGKRTSILTDLLRDALPEIPVDEAYRGNVEQGVVAWHERHGAHCFHGENNVWRALFALYFWSELMESPQGGFVSEFDRTPRLLQTGEFYAVMQTEIEQQLQYFSQSQQAFRHIQKQFTVHYGRVTNLFHWHSDLLRQLTVLMQAPAPALENHLRAMCKDYFAFTDGYPDLLGKRANGFFLEEVKAPGDQLRRNQARMIQHLRAIGFTVGIRPILWQIDSEQPYVVIDVETTGGGRDYHRITEVAVVRIEQGEIVAQWSQLINPERRIPHAITQLTGISNEMVADAPLFAEQVDTFLALCEGAIFVAHNVNFDYGFIRREFERLGRTFRMPKLCTVQLARKHLAKLSSYRLSALCEAYDIDLTNHHRALADARATAELFLLIQSHRLGSQTAP
ncbi:hypothetical protein CWE22_02210 [Pseudidiomarina aestuarii]|uniref:DNA-directed DNA polymerase n=1 Tax=Pseudidiomarina aestuarii TaxID=624146 RepID=A0A7Z6ZTJ0_9GAMM|nr:exonuclease domain-containing protein [Pseudidiomarina aestuarii]RUO41028.1 hypothetical protein CWE22_02210 [Pseudidiomarina aestuarii]